MVLGLTDLINMRLAEKWERFSLIMNVKLPKVVPSQIYSKVEVYLT